MLDPRNVLGKLSHGDAYRPEAPEKVLNSSKIPLHFGVGFAFAPAPEMTSAQVLAFQQRLATAPRGIAFQQVQHQGNALTLTRSAPPLNVIITPMAAIAQPGVPGVSQIAVTSVQPTALPEEFADEAADVLSAYREVWPPPAQLLSRECVVRYLAEVKEAHAFRYLWEGRLHQKPEAIAPFGRPILGGGLRFVFPAREATDEPFFDVKIESFFPNPKQLFIELNAKWGTTPPSTGFDPAGILNTAMSFVNGAVMEYLQSDT